MWKFIDMLQYSIVIAIIAVVYIQILSKEGQILEKWFEYGKRFEDRWFYNPVWGCHLCFSGQVALWIYLLNYIFQDKTCFIYKIIPIFAIESFSIFWLIFIICQTILSAFFLGFIYNLSFNKQKNLK